MNRTLRLMGRLAVGLILLVFAGCGSRGKNSPVEQTRVSTPPQVPQEAQPSDAEVAEKAADTSAKPTGALLTSAAEAAPAPKKTSAKAKQPAPKDAAAALKRAQNQKKHAFLLFYKQGDETCDKMRKTFSEAEKALAKKAVFYAADIDAAKDKETIAKYQVANAPLPLTLVFAPNGVIVNAHVGKAVDTKALGDSFASAKLAEVLKHLQDRKLVLLCAQNDHTKHNSESMRAAEAAAEDARAGGQLELVRIDPRDGDSADLLKQVKLDGSLKEASICILIPPNTLGKTVTGATTKEALWNAIVSSMPTCGSGCGPGGCG